MAQNKHTDCCHNYQDDLSCRRPSRSKGMMYLSRWIDMVEETKHATREIVKENSRLLHARLLRNSHATRQISARTTQDYQRGCKPSFPLH